MKRIVVELDDDQHQAIKEKAVRMGKSMRQILTELLRKWVRRGGGLRSRDF